MTEVDEAIYARRSEQMLYAAGQRFNLQISSMVAEPVMRERRPSDDREWPFNQIERQGLMVSGQMWRDRRNPQDEAA